MVNVHESYSWLRILKNREEWQIVQLLNYLIKCLNVLVKIIFAEKLG